MFSKKSWAWALLIVAATMLAAVATSKERRPQLSQVDPKLQSMRLVEVGDSSASGELRAYQVGGFGPAEEPRFGLEEPFACRWVSASFGSFPSSWDYSYLSYKITGGRLELKSTSSSYIGHTDCSFNPSSFFTLSMNVWKKTNNNWIGFQPFNDEGPVFSIGSAWVDGLGAAILKDGRIGLVGYDYAGQSWVIFNAKKYTAVTKLGVRYSSSGIALLVNGKQVSKISGSISSVPDQDTLWLIVSQTGTTAQFDNVCGN